jgi:cyclase
METFKIRPHITAFIPEGTIISQVGCNIGLLQTNEGIIVVDTSVSVKRMGEILKLVGIRAADVCLVIHTHAHADHINGNRLFRSPVICHHKAKNMVWKRCAKSQSLTTFDDQHLMDVGGVHLHLIHVGGHTPESIVVWLPTEKVLFAGDLIFAGRSPFLASVTKFDTLVKALKWLPSLGAEVIVPGHGPLCDVDEVVIQINYLESTKEIVKQHVDDRHSLSIIRRDPALPRLPGRNHERNIEWIYKQLVK